MDKVFEKLKMVSVRNRQRIIEVVGLDTKYQQLMILKYCEQLSRDSMADRFGLSPDAIDKAIAKSKEQFVNILQNEYKYFTKDQQELLELITKD